MKKYISLFLLCSFLAPLVQASSDPAYSTAFARAMSLLDQGCIALSERDGPRVEVAYGLAKLDAQWKALFPEAESYLDFFVSFDGCVRWRDSFIFRKQCREALSFKGFSCFLGQEKDAAAGGVYFPLRASKIREEVLGHMAVLATLGAGFPQQRVARWLVAAYVAIALSEHADTPDEVKDECNDFLVGIDMEIEEDSALSGEQRVAVLNIFNIIAPEESESE